LAPTFRAGAWTLIGCVAFVVAVLGWFDGALPAMAAHLLLVIAGGLWGWLVSGGRGRFQDRGRCARANDR
jgi:hypothetical protein